MNDNEDFSHQAILIEELLAAPFVAASNANSKMAQEQAKFLMDACFDSKNGVFSPKMISLTVNNTKVSHSETTSELITLQLPLITIIPFNSLCVKDVSVKFDLEIISHVSSTTNDDEKNNDKTQMRGSVSSSNNASENNKSQRRNQSKMSVEINAGSIPLPIGLTTLLDFYTKNIQIKS
jgi:hypothetical protein